MNTPRISTSRLIYFSMVLALILLACNLPFGLSRSTPAPTPMPLPPLPPALVETDPQAGSRLPLNSSITFYFNQPMERESVESGLSIEPAMSGSFAWLDDSTLSFTPGQALPPETDITLTFDESTHAENGVGLPEPVSLTFRTADSLEVVQRLPEPGSSDVSATSAVVAAFNQPVVPLGADADSLPAAFTLEPAASGHGEWINTSTYIFYPDPPLQGGTTYTAQLDRTLTGTMGSPLAAEAAGDWTFVAAMPRVIETSPSTEERLSLDVPIELTFNTPMDTASVEASFSFSDADDQEVPGEITWNEDFTAMTFTPASLLERNRNYTAFLSGEALARGGTPIGESTSLVFLTYPNFSVAATTPPSGGLLQQGNLRITMSSPPQEDELEQSITITPEIPGRSSYVVDKANATDIVLYSYELPSETYTVHISGNLHDRWGQALGRGYTFTFRMPAAPAQLQVPYMGANSMFARSDNPIIQVQATNLSSVNVSLASLSLPLMMSLNGRSSYYARQAYSPEDPLVWSQPVSLPLNKNQVVSIDLSPYAQAIETGVYFLSLQGRGSGENLDAQKFFVVASKINLTFKIGTTDALVWAVDLHDNTPVVNKNVVIYNEEGDRLASGTTDADGVWHTQIPVQEEEPYQTYYAVLGNPGQDEFGMAVSSWQSDIEPWSFDISAYHAFPSPKVYFYTDRPIYRPGQTVYFRAVVRQKYDGRYTEAGLNHLIFTINDGYEQSWDFDLSLSDYGTTEGEFRLPVDAYPGSYSISGENVDFYAYFDVAEYRKPEIDLSVILTPEDLKSGQTLRAEVDARYFFDAPASRATVEWRLYRCPDSFRLPDYHVGIYDNSWMNFYDYTYYRCRSIDIGESLTGLDGKLHLTFSDLEDAEDTEQLVLETTTQDESGFPVSARAEVTYHPSDFYVGLRSDSWVGRAGTEMGFDVLTVDWAGESSGSHTLKAEFSLVEWRKEVVQETPYSIIQYVPEYTLVSSSNFTTGTDGEARLVFTPDSAGTYMLDVQGGGAHSQIMLWVGGAHRAVWPDLDAQHITLTADKDTYRAGETARVFIPNPIGEDTLALVSVELSTVRQWEVIQLSGAGETYTLPLTNDEAPNVYLSVTQIGGEEFRQGFLNLEVEPESQELQVELTSTPERSEPRGEVTFDIRVTDWKGIPVVGEFSLSVVDLAVLALVDSNTEDILPFFYKIQPLGVFTGLALAADTTRVLPQPEAGGKGGGGDGGIVSMAREDFEDTAYWAADIVTDDHGRASVSIQLPDNLTTWKAEVRGLTSDTRVGQAQLELVSTKELLIRPVTPRFLVVEDHILMAAVVHNNTDDDLRATVSLQATNFNLDDPSASAQQVDITAGGRALVTWWGTAQEAEFADLVFSVSAGGLQDAARPNDGLIPILHYISPQTFSTAGQLSEADTKLEVVSLPPSFDPIGGDLTVEMAPSLAATLLSSLDSIEEPPSTCSNETLLSYLLPTVEVYAALRDSGLETSEMGTHLSDLASAAVERLLSHQNDDGGWGWWGGGPEYLYYQPRVESDPYLTAYMLFGLQRAMQAGVEVSETAIQEARQFLESAITGIDAETSASGLDLATFEAYVLQVSGGVNYEYASSLHDYRDLLSPWSQALLAMTLESASPGSEEAGELLSNLEASAIRSATGAHWESEPVSWRMPGTPLYTTAMIVYALAQQDPASPLLADAVRYLSSQRDAHGYWRSSYETAWVILALNAYMLGTGGYAAEFDFNATLNGLPFAEGQASGPSSLTTVTAVKPIGELEADTPNALMVTRGSGTGTLYYRAALQVYRPVEQVEPLDAGLSLSRAYYDASCEQDCAPLSSVVLEQGARLTVRLTLNVPNDVYYLSLEDYFPAGAEVLNPALRTSQQMEDLDPEVSLVDPDNPYAKGWGWWYFDDPRIYDDHVMWTVSYLPAGTYMLTYTLIPVQAGEYRLIPARAWLEFFPEVQGTSAGGLFEIEEGD